jgi:glycerol-3-phosphate acyltransferase PlsY
MIGCWLVIALIFRISSLAAIVSFVTMAAYGTLYAELSDLQMGVIWVISALSVLRHHQNIKQLLKGEESRISFSKKP